MNDLLPTRFRDPIADPDRSLAAQYRLLFGHDLPTPTRGQVETLAKALMRGDPLGDGWVAALHGEARGGRDGAALAGASPTLFERGLTAGRAAVADAPPALRALLEQLETVPLWLDAELLALGGQVFRRTGLLGFIVLADFGLMGGYRSAAVAKTLTMTGRLRDAAAERLIETGRFVMRVTAPGALAIGGDGYVAAAKVRLVHAHVRAAHLRSPSWRVADWGVPLNQADLLGTNLLFSIGLVAGARKLGLRFSPDEVHALLHLWRYVGYLLGVDDVLLPADEQSAARALFMVGVSQPRPDADSVTLARALHELPLRFARDRGPWMRRLVSVEMGLRASFTRRMLGDETADDLGLPRSGMRHAVGPLVGLIRGAELLREHVPSVNRAAQRWGGAIARAGQGRLDARLKATKTPVA